MNKPFGLIYKATNRVNGKIYIGQTVKTFEQKLIWYRRYVKSKGKTHETRYIHKALCKYGFDGFVWSVQAYGSSQEHLDYLEQYWIKRLETMTPEIGYNLESGGRKGKTPSEKSKNQCRATIRKKVENGWVSPKKGKPSGVAAWSKGMTMTRDHCTKLSKAHTKQQRSVLCVELNKAFDRINDAAKFVGTCAGNISQACKRGSLCKGYTWRYLSETTVPPRAKPSDEECRQISIKHMKGRRLLCVELNVIFECLKDAYEHFDIGSSNLCSHLNGRTPNCAGYTWKYITAEEAVNIPLQDLSIQRSAKRTRKVICVELNRTFDRIVDAAKFVGAKRASHIWAALNGKKPTAHGYHWQYLPQEPLPEEPLTSPTVAAVACGDTTQTV